MIIKIDYENPRKDLLKEVANIIKCGGLVIFPTETLYGLGGKACEESVLKRIYSIKERPPDKPLPVMTSEISQISELVSDFPSIARLLASAYWPGPLTMIMKSKPHVSKLLTCGTNTVGIRIPDYRIVLDLLKYTGEPVAVTSANLSGEKDLLTMDEIITTFKDKVDIILDGGTLKYAIPSTVVDVTKSPPVILREGKISSEEIFKILKSEKAIHLSRIKRCNL